MRDCDDASRLAYHRSDVHQHSSESAATCQSFAIRGFHFFVLWFMTFFRCHPSFNHRSTNVRVLIGQCHGYPSRILKLCCHINRIHWQSHPLPKRVSTMAAALSIFSFAQLTLLLRMCACMGTMKLWCSALHMHASQASCTCSA